MTVGGTIAVAITEEVTMLGDMMGSRVEMVGTRTEMVDTRIGMEAIRTEMVDTRTEGAMIGVDVVVIIITEIVEAIIKDLQGVIIMFHFVEVFYIGIQ